MRVGNTGAALRISLARLLPAFALIAIQGCGGGGASGGPTNVAPTAVANISLSTAYSSQALTLDGGQSTDPDGQIASYIWTQVAGPAVTLSSARSAQASFVAPPVDNPSTLRFRLQVTDDKGATGSSDVSVSVSPGAVQLDASVAAGARFKVDDEPIELIVSGATFGGASVQPTSLRWTSSIQGDLTSQVALGQVIERSLEAGTHTLTLVADCGALGTVRRSFNLPVLPRMLSVTSFQETPATGYTALMPVVAVTIVPTLDGENVDMSQIPQAGGRPPEWSSGKVKDVLAYTDTLTTRSKYFLEERSRYHGYRDPAARPYLGYQVVAHYVFYEPIPVSSQRPSPDPNKPYVDLFRIMDRISGQKRVDEDGVREIWLWAYTGDKVAGLWESNMSSPTTGDVSNSDQYAGDLPVYGHTYYVYGYNYQRTQAEAVHNHGHQLERMFAFVDQLASGSVKLFWGDFVGMSDGGWPSGQVMNPDRCGWTHMPPNAAKEYDYTNSTVASTNCEDWHPDGSGARKDVDSAYFAALPYSWPDGDAIPQKAESQFYLWWSQNVPGDGNVIPYGSTTMENWWRFVADWDGAIRGGLRLYR